MVGVVAEGTDYSTSSIAELLRKETKVIHDRIATQESVGWLTRGELSKAEYARYLMMLYHVYATLEAALDRFQAHPVLEPTYNPKLARAPSLDADIAHILNNAEWKTTDPVHAALQRAPPPALDAYLQRLRTLAGDGDGAVDGRPERLLAHAYVRYMGDLSGGQAIRRVIAKAYGLQDGLGTSFYEFPKLGGAGEAGRSATIGDMGRIKEWFRDGMNEGVGADMELKYAIVDESREAFELNRGLLSLLERPTTSEEDATPTSESTSSGALSGIKHAVLSLFKSSSQTEHLR